MYWNTPWRVLLMIYESLRFSDGGSAMMLPLCSPIVFEILLRMSDWSLSSVVAGMM